MRDFLGLKIGFTGVPGSGKTTLCTKLAGVARDSLGTKVVSQVNEYARRYISKYGPPTALWEQVRILQKQIEWETSCSNSDLIVCDSPTPLGFLYSVELRNPVNRKDSILMTDLFSMLQKFTYEQPYDIIFHLPPILTPVKDGVRLDHQFDINWREQSNAKIKYILEIFPPKELIEVNINLPEDWESFSDESKRHFLGEARLQLVLSKLKSKIKQIAN